MNGFQSETLPVKFGVPQGSVLGPTLFSLFCNDLRDIAGVRECEIHMYADDTTLYLAESSPDKIVVVLNSVPQKLYEWCCRNRLIPHCGKTECMILIRGQFVGPLQAMSLENSVVNEVKSTRSLGVQLDSNLNWNVHVHELIKSFIQKLNLLRSLYFLPARARADFYFKVILPFVNYGLDV